MSGPAMIWLMRMATRPNWIQEGASGNQSWRGTVQPCVCMYREDHTLEVLSGDVSCLSLYPSGNKVQLVQSYLGIIKSSVETSVLSACLLQFNTCHSCLSPVHPDSRRLFIDTTLALTCRVKISVRLGNTLKTTSHL
jgi:hypothetical protein